jgi:starvation-inducible DNA-binding protein
MNEDLINALKVLVANQYVLYLKAHGYHWNVEGKDFKEYHAFFEEIYSDVYESIDPTAENIRKLGAFAPFTLSRLMELKTIEDVTVAPTTEAMTRDLLNANEAILMDIDKTFALATAANQQGIANFLAERDDQHRKWIWQLRVSLKED